jgi:tetratricopeptide (TPR) repeat protein
MNEQRVRQLELYLREDPHDPFPRYALALELMQENPRRAEELLQQLLQLHPDYIPTYYHAGQFYIAHGNLPVARKIVETGKQKAEAGGDRKTAAELGTLLMALD